MGSYQPHSNVVSTTVDQDESVLLHLEAQQYYSLNETGSRIWQLLSQGHDAETIATAIAKEWAISAEDARQHICSLLRELDEAGLVERPSSDATS